VVLLIGERVQGHQFGGPWTVEKLKALRKYLERYAQALKNQSFTRIYIDAFAAKRQQDAGG
jgi:three-Cys-motif partner protein